MSLTQFCQIDFNNNFLNLKDQMDHFFSQNPQLQEAIKFEPFREPNSDDEEELPNTNQANNPQQNQGENHPGQQQNQNTSQNKSKKKGGYQPPVIEHRNLEEIDRKKKQAFDSNDQSEMDSTQKQKEVKFNMEGQSKEKSKLWTTLTKDVVRMGQFGCKTPTLETVNHRLNIFKSKIEKIDYLEYLQKEMTQTSGLLSQQNGSNNNAGANSNANNGSNTGANGDQADDGNSGGNGGVKQQDYDEEDNVGRDAEGNLIYFSFKKRMQMSLREKVEQSRKKQEEEDKLKKNEVRQRSGDRRVNITSRGAADALKLIKQFEIDKKRKTSNDYKHKRKSFTGLRTEDSEEREKHTQPIEKDQNLNFQTRVGIALYQTYQQCAGDKESFKKTANFILKDYNKTKQQFYKKKPFPPQTTKFTNEETKALNVYLPDFTSNLYAPNKNNLFANIDTFELPPGTPEGDFIQIVDKILDGAVLRFWKESQNQQQ